MTKILKAKLLQGILFSIFTCMIATVSSAQVIDYTFDDGTEMAVEILDQGPDNGYNSAIYVGGLGITGMKYIGFDHYQPGKFFLSAMSGFDTYMGELNYFIYNSLKDITLNQSAAGKGTLKYMVEFPGKKRTSFGPHLNVNYLNQMDNPNVSYYNGKYKMAEIAIGMTYLTARSASLKQMGGDVRRGSRYMRLNLDAIIYSMREIDPESYTRVWYQASSTTTDTFVTTETVDEVLNKVGYRFYLDGKMTSWGSGRLAIKYAIGIQTSPLKVDGLKPQVMGCFGIGYSFNVKKK